METILTSLFRLIVSFYRRYISPYLAPRCRYYPTCSQYALLCLDQFSFSKAFPKIIIRICKCNPLFPGGEDFP